MLTRSKQQQPDGIDADEWSAVPEQLLEHYRPVPAQEADALRQLMAGNVTQGSRVVPIQEAFARGNQPDFRAGAMPGVVEDTPANQRRLVRQVRMDAAEQAHCAATVGVATVARLRVQHTCVICRQYLPGDVDLKELFGNSATVRCCSRCYLAAPSVLGARAAEDKVTADDGSTATRAACIEAWYRKLAANS